MLDALGDIFLANHAPDPAVLTEEQMRHRRRAELFLLENDGPTEDQAMRRIEDAMEAEQVLFDAGLTRRERQCLVLSRTGTLDEVAAELHISRTTVKTRIASAREKLARYLERSELRAAA